MGNTDSNTTHWVWVAGHSAAGKNSLIETLVKHPNDSLGEILELPATKLVRAVLTDVNPPVRRKPGHAHLIHWQNATNHLVNVVLNLFPGDTHWMIHLQRAEPEHFGVFLIEERSRREQAGSPHTGGDEIRTTHLAHKKINCMAIEQHRCNPRIRFTDIALVEGQYYVL